MELFLYFISKMPNLHLKYILTSFIIIIILWIILNLNISFNNIIQYTLNYKF